MYLCKSVKMDFRAVIWCFIAAVCVPARIFSEVQVQDYWSDREFYEKSCFNCHTMENYLWPRTFKSWELTIANMRRYIADDYVLDEEGGRRIARFLTEYVGEGVLLVPPGMEREVASPSEPAPVPAVETASLEPPVEEEPAPAVAVAGDAVDARPPPVESTEAVPANEARVNLTAVQPETVQPETPQRATAARQPKLKMPMLKSIWNPGRAALKGARLTGFLAVAALLGLLSSGFARKSLRRKFRPVHRWLAWILFVSLSAHGVIYIFEYGTPNVLWYWFGFVGLIVLIAVQVQGKLRRRYKIGTLSLHIAAGCAGLFLSVLHWIWAWL